MIQYKLFLGDVVVTLTPIDEGVGWSLSRVWNDMKAGFLHGADEEEAVLFFRELGFDHLQTIVVE